LADKDENAKSLLSSGDVLVISDTVKNIMALILNTVTKSCKWKIMQQVTCIGMLVTVFDTE
jgi:hypothetical protein